MLRPSEAAGLGEDDCTLPESGWGLLGLAETLPAVGKDWTDSGQVHEHRGLKTGRVKPPARFPYLTITSRFSAITSNALVSRPMGACSGARAGECYTRPPTTGPGTKRAVMASPLLWQRHRSRDVHTICDMPVCP